MQNVSGNQIQTDNFRDFSQSIRSDDLPRFAGVLRQISILKDQVEVFEVDLILDANVVIRDLLWLARKRSNPTARTELMELMDIGVVRAYAPYYLRREINVNLPLLAREHDIPFARLQGLWRTYRSKIVFVAVGGPAKSSNVADPKDVPYLRLQQKMAIPIVSEDPHLTRMGAKVVRFQVFGPLRAYSRNAAIEYHLKFTGVGAAMIGCGVIESLVRLVGQTGKLPKPILWGGVILIGLLVVHPKSRAKILDILEQLVRGSSNVFIAAIETLGPMIDRHLEAQTLAQQHLANARGALGQPQNTDIH